MSLQYPSDVLEQIAPLRAVKSKLLPAFEKGWHWKSSAEDVMCRNPPGTSFVISWKGFILKFFL